MKILITAIGSISASFVIQTIKDMKMKAVGVDIYPREWIATSKEVDYFYQVPRVSEIEQYQIKILELCEKHQIKMIIPLTDVEVDYFAIRKEEFLKKGIIVSVSRKDVIQLVRDKFKVYSALNSFGVRVIPTYNRVSYLENCNVFPCVAKRVNGRSSEGLFILKNADDLNRSEFYNTTYIFQPLIKGDIITVDVIKHSSAKNIYIARKELTRTSNGAGIAVEIIHAKGLHKTIEQFCRTIDFHGCINIEFIENKLGYYLMDINPRFSAGVAFSNIAGYNFVKNHILYFLNKEIEDLKQIEYGKVITRKYVEVIV